MATVIDDLLVRLGFDADTSGAARFDTGLGKVLKTAGQVAAIGGAAIAGFGALVIRTAGNFEEAMNGVRAVSGATGADFDALRNKAKELGETTAYSATEAANGMEFLAMAGMNTEQVLATIPHALSLAAAGGIELSRAADIMSNVMTGMGLSAEEAERAADVLAATAAGANVDISMLGESMKYAAPIAKQLGISLEDTAASMGVLGNAGIQGSEAGTALRAIYTRLATHKKSKEWFDALGLSVTDANGNMKGMVTILKELQEASKDMSAQDKLTIYKDTVGTEAMSALGVTIDSIADGSLDKLIGKLDSAKGSAASMAATRMEGFNGQLKQLSSAVEGLMISIADTGLLNVATEVIKEITKGVGDLMAYLPTAVANVTGFFNWFKENGKTIITTLKTIGVIAGVIGAALVLMYAPVIGGFLLMKATGILSFLMLQAAAIASAAATAAAWLVAFAPFLLIGAIIAVVIGLLWLIYQNWQQIAAGLVAEWERIKSAFSAGIESIKSWWSGLMTSISSAFSAVSDSVKAIWEGLWNGMKSIASGVIDSVITKVRSIITMITDAISKVKELAQYSPSNLITGAKDWIKSKVGIGGSDNGGSNSVSQTINVNSASEANMVANNSITNALRKQNNGYK